MTKAAMSAIRSSESCVEPGVSKRRLGRPSCRTQRELPSLRTSESGSPSA